jgi:hypothetical protein
MRNVLGIFTIVMVLTLGVVLLPIEVDIKVSSMGKVFPVRELNLVRSQDDKIVMVARDNLAGVVTFYQVINFERGDAVKLIFSRQFKIGDKIGIGDTIGRVISAEMEYQLVRLKGLVQTEMATLDVLKTGAKEELIKELENRLAYAEQQVNAQRKIFERLKILYEKNLISQQEYEIAESTLRLYEINFNVVKAQLEAFKTGAKPEEIRAVEIKIKALNDEINALIKKVNSFYLLSPIAGMVFKFSSSDTIISVADESDYVIISPFKVELIHEVKEGQEVEIISSQGILKGKIFGIDRYTYFVNGWENIFVRIKIEGESKLPLNSLVKCKVILGKSKLKDYMYRILTNTLKLEW